MGTFAPALYVISDRHLAGGVPALIERLVRVADALPAGTLAVQVREKDLPPRELVALARAVVDALAPRGVPVLVNDRFDLALAAGAAGVHLASLSMDSADVRTAYGGLVAVSTHSVADLVRLRPGDVDFAVFGPTFETPSKRPFGPPRGVDALREAAAISPVPVVALGGIRLGNAAELRASGAAGIAGISAVLAAPDPVDAARRLVRAAREARQAPDTSFRH